MLFRTSRVCSRQIVGSLSQSSRQVGLSEAVAPPVTHSRAEGDSAVPALERRSPRARADDEKHPEAAPPPSPAQGDARPDSKHPLPTGDVGETGE